MSRPRAGPVVIADPDPSWRDAFEGLRERLLPVFDGIAVHIEHIGSTAVPGLAAKPIIDLVVVVPDDRHIPAAIERLATLGYEHQGDLGVPGREAFRGGPAGPAHHLYLSAAHSRSLDAHLAFRDALRADPALAHAYEDLKRRLAATLGHDRDAYTDGKGAFVAEVLQARGRSAVTARWTLRTATPADGPFLVRMLAHAAYPPWHEPRPTPAEVLRDPAVARYILGWPRHGDAGVIALDRAGRRIGAAWYRRLTADEPGYGYVDDATPEVAIGIGPRWRGRGLGTALMRRLLDLAREEGYHRLSLSVSLANPAAVRLYRSVGFETVREDDGHPVMVWSSSGGGP